MTRDNPHAPIGILYEHPLWFEPLFDELDRTFFELHQSGRPNVKAKPALVVASAFAPEAAISRAEPMSQGFGTRKQPDW